MARGCNRSYKRRRSPLTTEYQSGCLGHDGSQEYHNLLDDDSSRKEADRISELPNCVIELILSFLPTKDAVKTGILSNRWSYLWTTIPCLSFRQNDFSSIFSRDFIEFINTTLTLYRGMNVERFSLSLYALDECADDNIDKWIHSMTLANVKELNLNFGCHSKGYFYLLPLHLYSNTRLTKLYLSTCHIRPVGEIRWDSLKILSIGETKLDDDLMKNITEGCPLLEFLELYRFGGLNKLSFTNRNLTKLVISGRLYDEDDNTFEIRAPFLQSLVMSGVMWIYNFRVLNAKSLVDCSLNFMSITFFDEYYRADILFHLLEDLRHAKELTLGAWFIRVISKWELKGMSCPLLECRKLSIETSLRNRDLPGIACLLQNSPSLETLIINLTNTSILEIRFNNIEDPSILDEENYRMSLARNFKCLMSYLKTVKITGVVPLKFDEFTVPLVHILVTNARVLENITVKAGEVPSWKELFQMAQRLLSLPRSSPCSVFKFLE